MMTDSSDTPSLPTTPEMFLADPAYHRLLPDSDSRDSTILQVYDHFHDMW
jgi:hypothetical protein